MIGTTLAHYRITGELGSGGMGEVWRAEDEKLGREVALKVLPADVAGDADRLARFEREAKVLASLNHPNIAHLFGLETAEADQRTVGEGFTPSSEGDRAGINPAPTIFLVMELVEGEDLSDRIARGPVPVDEAIPIALQIAEALEAAHEQGIVHRDLKPANIKLTKDGTVKVLDFGLAKAWETESSDSSLSLSPTMTQHATIEGVILGTAAYMSPEQARGKKVDRRADIWAFGVVLWEMLTGHKLFEGETVSDVMAAVLTSDPEMSELPPVTPASVRHLIERCLRRDPRQRMRDMGDVRLELEDGETKAVAEPNQPDVQAAHAGWSVWLGWAGLAVMAVAIALRSLLGIGSSGTAFKDPIALSVMLPSDLSFATEIKRPFAAISPDGEEMVVTAHDGESSILYRRSLDSPEFERLEGTEGATSPFYSPDGRWVGFTSGDGRVIKKLSIDGGQVITLAEGGWGGGSWGEDDTIIYTPFYTDGLWRVSAAGSDAHELTRPDPTIGELNHSWPDHVPGTDAVVFTSFRLPLAESRIEVLDTVTGDRRVLVENAVFARFVGAGFLVFVRDSVLMAAPFDRRSLEMTGPPAPVFEDAFVAPFEGNSQFAVSDNGTVLWVPASILQPPTEVVLVDRGGRSEVLLEADRRYSTPSLSPNGRMLALTIDDGDPDIWVYGMERRILNRLTFTPRSEFAPLWYPMDGGSSSSSMIHPSISTLCRSMAAHRRSCSSKARSTATQMRFPRTVAGW